MDTLPLHASGTVPSTGSAQVAETGAKSGATNPTETLPAQGHGSSPSATQHPNVHQVQEAVRKLQHKLAQTAPSFTLEAGLDPNGDHPNQVLIRLSDTVTKQVFFSYYVPAEQITQSASSGQEVSPGTLLRDKA